MEYGQAYTDNAMVFVVRARGRAPLSPGEVA
jgi:hypothetical protein